MTITTTHRDGLPWMLCWKIQDGPVWGYCFSWVDPTVASLCWPLYLPVVFVGYAFPGLPGLSRVKPTP